MNSRVNYIVITLFLVLISIGCGKSDDNNSQTSILNAEVDGVLRNCSSVYLQPAATNSNETYSGMGGATLQSPNFIFNFIFPIENGIGTYQLSENENSGYISISHGWLNSNNRAYIATNGEIIITDMTSNSYKGVFSFTAKEIDFDDIILVEDGVFEIFF